MRSRSLKLVHGAEIDSTELNQWSEQVLADLADAVGLQEAASQQASLVTLLQSYEDLFLSRQQEELAREFRLLRREIQAMELTAGQVDADLPISETTVTEGLQMAIYGAVLPPANLVVDRLPEGATLQIQAIPAANQTSVNDTALSSVADHRYNTVWLRTVELPITDPTSSVEVQLEIDLPDYVPTTRLNLVGLLPFPSWGLDLVAIEVLNDQNVWISVQDELKATGPVLATFAPVHTHRLRIHLRQRQPLLFGDRKIFVLGLRDLTALSSSFGERIQLESTLHLPRPGMWVNGVSLIPTTSTARVYVRIGGSDVLPVYVSGEEVTVALTIEAEELGPVRGITVHLAP